MPARRTSIPTRTPRGRPPHGKADDRNLRILDAATAVFLEEGFAGTRMTTIARRAGCSLETLYNAYPNKAQMFSALTTRKATGLFEAVGDLHAEPDPERALLRFATEVLALMSTDHTGELHRVVIGESRNFPELGESFWKEGPGRGVDLLTAYFRTMPAGGEFVVSDPARAAEVFIGMVMGGATMRATLGVATRTNTARQQQQWAQYTVGLFIALLKQGRL